MSQLTSQMRARDKEMVPRFLVQAMFAVMAGSLALTAFAVWTDRPMVGVASPSPVVAEQVVTFEGLRDGHVTVHGPEGALLADASDPGNGFLAVIARSITRERFTQGAAADAPLRVARLENGHIVLIDTVTSFEVPLLGYGPDNVAAFARLVD